MERQYPTLVEIRELIGVSAQALERTAQLSRGTVKDIENGQIANPTVYVVTKLLKALRETYHLPGARYENICQLREQDRDRG